MQTVCTRRSLLPLRAPGYEATEEEILFYRLVFCAPEAIDTPKWRDVIAKPEVSSRVVAVVVDEAHCVSKLYVQYACTLYVYKSFILAWAALAIGAMTSDHLMDEYMKYEHSFPKALLYWPVQQLSLMICVRR